MRVPALVRLYARLAGVVAPLAYRRITPRLRQQGIDPKRFPERMGHATAPRPDGRLLWFHAASVGESLSILRLIQHMGDEDPALSFLITSGTATSAQLLARRLPPRCQHQFAPLDSRSAIRRFLTHWRPDAAVFVESELWPNMLRETRRTGAPLALLNARISDRSARQWKRFGRTARYLLSLFTMIHTQDARTTQHLHDLGLDQAVTGRNLKSASGPLPYDADMLGTLTQTLASRPHWVASSTHPGEEQIILDAHETLLAKYPDLLLILVPRHPERGDEVQRLIDARNQTQARRSTGGSLGPGVQVYLADTLGETGLWYALSSVVCLGGSFTPVGGHNPYEPAYAGAAVLHGPLYTNFSGAYAEFNAFGGAVEVANGQALADEVDRLLSHPDQLRDLCTRSSRFAEAQEDMLDTLSDTLSRALGLR
ncbi:3-deoxy-D-manno-octulosonic acid transferase [Roseovarius pelagicus]|uniref:3-deoxy-D-manno-octulosonic acid transferase n=1 Tax=Roseovarius pelagicus TaxID=2980108 RepID=A0ABY6DEQ8_9RHOB|nr:3-deoxy-D-manno-octulosonic acid transferase [Roseovarius pelagicus]UXX84000.1 3-deoxy-D-manno-octulosonic acid transferase [Roseovarius pelagicus]